MNEKLYKVVLTDHWGNNSGKTVEWDWDTLNYCLHDEDGKPTDKWVKSYEKIDG